MGMNAPVTMKVTSNGQISLPAEVRHRWNTDRVVVYDTPGGLLVRPFDPDAIRKLRGRYKPAEGTLIVDGERQRERVDEARGEVRRGRRS